MNDKITNYQENLTNNDKQNLRKHDMRSTCQAANKKGTNPKNWKIRAPIPKTGRQETKVHADYLVYNVYIIVRVIVMKKEKIKNE